MNFPSLPIVAACAALFGALIAWLIVQMRSQRRQHLLEQQLAERTQQYRFARQAQETAEEALADSRRHIQDLQIGSHALQHIAHLCGNTSGNARIYLVKYNSRQRKRMRHNSF